MPTIAGFYASHQDCREWLKGCSPRLYHESDGIGAAFARMAAEDVMLKLAGRRVFDAELISPLGWSGDSCDREYCDLMLVRRYSPHKKYIAPSRSGFDVIGKKLIKQHLGLNVSNWKVVWYDNNDPELWTSVLEPEDHLGLGASSSC
ncbi:hypothetical protein FRC06_005232 [Ceratobasidium sp. 370]|nr:hypothetical protein FRC06_005232 [Ceratobasidium sp. 370]